MINIRTDQTVWQWQYSTALAVVHPKIILEGEIKRLQAGISVNDFIF